MRLYYSHFDFRHFPILEITRISGNGLVSVWYPIKGFIGEHMYKGYKIKILTSGFFLLLNEFLKVLTKFDEVAVGIVDDTARFFTREAA